MLVLNRKVGETLKIGDDVEISILYVRNGQVRIGIDAPKEISVHRKEIYERIQLERANQEAKGADHV